MHFLKYLIALSFIFTSLLYAETVPANSVHAIDAQASKIMAGLQTGYAWIESKDTHMTDDSGFIIGLHLMQHSHTHSESKQCSNHALSWAAGLHATMTNDPHYGAMLGIMYALNPQITLSFMPGYIWMKHDSHSAMQHSSMAGMGAGMASSMHSGTRTWSSEYATHFEFSISLEAFNQNLKPSFSWMTSKSHNLYSLGLNFEF